MDKCDSICSLCLQKKLLLHFASEESKVAAISVVACYFLFDQNLIPQHQICISCWHHITEFDQFSNQVKLAHELHFKQEGTYLSYFSEHEREALKPQQSIGQQVDFQAPDHDTSQICPEDGADNSSELSTTLSDQEHGELQSISEASPAPHEAPENHKIIEDFTDTVDDSKQDSQQDVDIPTALEDSIESPMPDSFDAPETESNDPSGAEMMEMSQTENQQIDGNTIESTQLLGDCDEPEYLDDSDDSNVSAQQPRIQKSMETYMKISAVRSAAEDNSLLDLILMDIDSNDDIEKAADASDKSNFSAQPRVQQDRRSDELISQHCNLDCTICGAKSSTFLQVMRHYKSQHNIKGHITCCDERYTVRRNLLDHVILQNNPAAFTCSKCPQSYLSTTAYRAHLSTHRPPDGTIHTCEFCGKQFPKRVKLMIHKKHHYTHKCDQCDASFKLRRDLLQHKATHHDVNIEGDNEKFICKVCSKSFASKDAARRHYANIHGPVRYMCESCPESFKSHFSYSYHKRTKHSQATVKPVQCSICERWLKSAAGLRKHMYLHEPNKKPLVCDICGKIAKHPQSLWSHKRYVHAKECPFKCLICKRTFVREKALKEHMAMHTGESLYKCSFCPRTFNSSANMHTHRKKQHPVELEKLFKQRSDQLRAIYEEQNGQSTSTSTLVPSASNTDNAGNNRRKSKRRA